MKGTTELAEFTFALKDLAAAYRKDIDGRGVDSYWEGLEDLPIGRVRAGMANAKRESRYMPSVAAIREYARLAQQDRASSTSRPQLEEGDSWCRRCEDTGWIYEIAFERAEDGPAMTERQIANLSRDDRERLVTQFGLAVPMYPRGRERFKTVACACRAENPVYQWKREHERGGSAKAEGR